MDAGRFDKRVTFYRRPYLDGRPRGEDRGDAWTDAYLSLWAVYVRLRAGEKLEAGALSNDEIGTLRIRDTVKARLVSSADRVMILGRTFAIASVSLPDRASGTILLDVSSVKGDS